MLRMRVALRSILFHTFLGLYSARTEQDSFRPDQFANGRCTGFDDSSVEVTA